MKENVKFYVYQHVRLDTGDIFYIGCGKTSNNRFDRANDLREKERNRNWIRVYKECFGKISVDIIFESFDKSECLKKEKQLISFYGRTENNTGILSNISKQMGRDRKKVSQYSNYGDLIRIWDDIYSPKKEIGVSFKSISHAIKRDGSAGGFIWRYVTDKPELKIKRYCAKNARSVYRFSLKGRLISMYDSIGEASRETGIDRASINHCAIGNRISCGGYRWSYTSKIIIPEHSIIIQNDLSGNKIKVFKSLSEIVDELKLSSSTAIRNCFCGKQKQAYGFKWIKLTMPAKELGLSSSRLSTTINSKEE